MTQIKMTLLLIAFLSTRGIHGQDEIPYDPSWGNYGTVLMEWTNKIVTPKSTIELQDGSILTCGHVTTFFDGIQTNACLIKLDEDGNPDPNFGEDGFASIPMADQLENMAMDLIEQPDGKIVLGGFALTVLDTIYDGQDTIVDYGVDFVLARCNSNGSLDQEFGTEGIVLVDLGDDWYEGIKHIFYKDERIIVCGESDQDDIKWTLMAFTMDGSFDNSYATNGINMEVSGRLAYATMLDDGSIIGCGYAVDPATDDGDVGLVKFDTNGNLDASFNSDGIAHIGDQEAFDGSWFYPYALLPSENQYTVIMNNPFNDDSLRVIRMSDSGIVDMSYGLSGAYTDSIDFVGFLESTIGNNERVASCNNSTIICSGYGSNAIKQFHLIQLNETGLNIGTIDMNSSVPEEKYAIYNSNILLTEDNDIIVTGISIDSVDFPNYTLHWIKLNQCLTVSQTEFDEVISNLTVYPNPADHTLNMLFSPLSNPDRIDIYNSTSQVVLSTLVFDDKSYSLSTTGLCNGVYTVEVKFENGTSEFSRVIVQH